MPEFSAVPVNSSAQIGKDLRKPSLLAAEVPLKVTDKTKAYRDQDLTIPHRKFNDLRRTSSPTDKMFASVMSPRAMIMRNMHAAVMLERSLQGPDGGDTLASCAL
jgi:hypothetical protein